MKFSIIIRREYITRLRKPSFWVIAIAVPLLLVVVYALPIVLDSREAQQTEVVVVDESTLFGKQFKSNDVAQYSYAGSFDYAYASMCQSQRPCVVLYIPARELSVPTDAFVYYTGLEPNAQLRADLQNQLNSILLANIALDVLNIDAASYHQLCTTTIRLHTQDLESGRDGYLEVKILLATLLACLIFAAIFLFAAQVMRGVMEEKSSRIVEVLLCSVRPTQLMSGKIIGIALVSLTQIALWVLLIAGGISVVHLLCGDLLAMAQQQVLPAEIATKGSALTAQVEAMHSTTPVSELLKGLVSINFSALLVPFVLYFILGYLFYAAMFAAVGAMTDPNTDTQQFSPLVSLPLFVPLVLMPVMMSEPSGALATVLSIVPFTSPIAMIFRIPFGVPTVQVVVSLLLLAAMLPLTTMLAAKIYEKGIKK